MFKLNFLITLLIAGLVSHVSATSPPACILACVNEQEKVSDFKAICTAESAQECLARACDNGEFKTAVGYFKSICQDGGHEVAKALPSATVTGASFDSSSPSETSAGSPNASDSAGNRLVGSASMGVLLTAMAASILV